MAQVQLRGRRAQLILKEESATGTYEVPAGDGTGTLLIEDGWSYTPNSTNFQGQYARSDFLNVEEVPGPASAVITWRMPIKGSGTAGTAPDFDVVMKACGWEVTNVVATSDTYAPHSAVDGVGGNPGPSYSCTLLVDGEAYPAKNGFANFVLSANVGEPGFLDVTFTGGYVAPLADALETTTTLDATTPPAFLGAGATIGGATPTGVTALTLDSGNVITLLQDANDTNGVTGARMVSRLITGSIDAEVLAARDDFSLWRAGTTGILNIGPIGGTAGNKWTLVVARYSLQTPAMSSVDGILKHTIPFMAASQPADVEGTTDPVTLAFT